MKERFKIILQELKSIKKEWDKTNTGLIYLDRAIKDVEGIVRSV